MSNDGGPVFSGQQDMCPDGDWNQTWDPGMSLLEHYAGLAMQGMLTNPGYNEDGYAAMTKKAFKLAEAMVAEAEKRRNAHG